jgi:Protein of unknown function (DUF3089)
MCARRFLAVVFWLTLIAVAAAFAIYQFGQQVLISSATPQGHFQAAAAGTGPDYSKIENWIARPEIAGKDNPSLWGPADWPPPTLQKRLAAVFYVHPTTYLRRDRWNAPVSGNADADFRTRLFIQSQASAFADAGEVWAPRYRQAAYGAFLLKSNDAHKALDLAYGDVLRAFDEFLRMNPGRPIVVAGHSQGALHVSRLLRDRAQQLKGRLVAAYVVGWPLSVTADLAPMGLAPCAAPDQTACVLSWQSFAEPANASLVLDAWQGTTGPSGVKRERRDMLCVNPITGTRDGAAPPQANPGTLVPTADLSNATLLPRTVGAHCDEGLLMLDGAIPPLGPFVLPGNNYHVYDYALFWGAIRADAERRLAAWQRR